MQRGVLSTIAQCSTNFSNFDFILIKGASNSLFLTLKHSTAASLHCQEGNDRSTNGNYLLQYTSLHTRGLFLSYFCSFLGTQMKSERVAKVRTRPRYEV
jgi:hypothetical protein